VELVRPVLEVTYDTVVVVAQEGQEGCGSTGYGETDMGTGTAL
jgi:hypothetical protein